MPCSNQDFASHRPRSEHFDDAVQRSIWRVDDLADVKFVGIAKNGEGFEAPNALTARHGPAL